MTEAKKEEQQIVELAKKTIAKYVETGQKIDPKEEVSGFLSKKRGVFVTIKKNGDLRGCIGTTSPTRENVVQEIIRNAVSACSKDPRFQPVQPEELGSLEISVDILGEQEPVSSREELDPEKYGVIVKKERKTGLNISQNIILPRRT